MDKEKVGHIHHGTVSNYKIIRPLSCYLPQCGRNRRSMHPVQQAENGTTNSTWFTHKKKADLRSERGGFM